MLELLEEYIYLRLLLAGKGTVIEGWDVGLDGINFFVELVSYNIQLPFFVFIVKYHLVEVVAYMPVCAFRDPQACELVRKED